MDVIRDDVSPFIWLFDFKLIGVVLKDSILCSGWQSLILFCLLESALESLAHSGGLFRLDKSLLDFSCVWTLIQFYMFHLSNLENFA